MGTSHILPDRRVEGEEKGVHMNSKYYNMIIASKTFLQEGIPEKVTTVQEFANLARQMANAMPRIKDRVAFLATLSQATFIVDEEGVMYGNPLLPSTADCLRTIHKYGFLRQFRNHRKIELWCVDCDDHELIYGMTGCRIR